MTEHTPGPHYLDFHSGTAYVVTAKDNSGIVIARTYAAPSGDPKEERANGQLFATAHALLAALEPFAEEANWIANVTQNRLAHAFGSRVTVDDIRRAAAAVAMARGKREDGA